MGIISFGKFIDDMHNSGYANQNKAYLDIHQKFRDQQIPNYLTQTSPDGYSVDKEKWSMDSETLKEKADEALEYLTKLEESIN